MAIALYKPTSYSKDEAFKRQSAAIGGFKSALSKNEPTNEPNLMDILAKAALDDKLTPSDYFHMMVDRSIITNDEWESQHLARNNLQVLIQTSPTFLDFDPSNPQTHASLTITNQPGPIFVPNANSPAGSFRVELLPHPLLPSSQSLQRWKISSLSCTLMNEVSGDDKKSSFLSKKRIRSNKTSIKRGLANASSVQAEYPFSDLQTTIFDLKFPSSGCKPVRVRFSCTLTDSSLSSSRAKPVCYTFHTLSNPFVTTTNCNQWICGLHACLRNFVFPNATTQAPFVRFFNHLQLAYLDTKGFSESRFLQPSEIRHWMVDSARDELNLARDVKLLEAHDCITSELFDFWVEVAAPVFYDLHTVNVGKLFQSLWSKGFIGIGDYRYEKEEEKQRENVSVSKPGYYRLNINTHAVNNDLNDSYLILHKEKKSYVLMPLERDHLGYFLHHSRNSDGCTHLVSATTADTTLPIEDIVQYATR